MSQSEREVAPCDDSRGHLWGRVDGQSYQCKRCGECKRAPAPELVEALAKVERYEKALRDVARYFVKNMDEAHNLTDIARHALDEEYPRALHPKPKDETP